MNVNGMMFTVMKDVLLCQVLVSGNSIAEQQGTNLVYIWKWAYND